MKRLRWSAAASCWLTAVLAAAHSRYGFPGAPDAQRALREPAGARIETLQRAHRILPRHTAVSLELGLEWERAGQADLAQRILEQAAALDRRYLPAWTLANFYFRAGDEERFWRWAQRAAALCFDDFRPLLRLADLWAPEPSALLARLGDRPALLRAYLDFLIGAARWEHAQQVASRLGEQGDPADRPRLEDLARRLEHRPPSGPRR